MALLDQLKPTGRKGVFFREHPTRREGVKKDRLLVLRYTIGGKTRAEVFGWNSEGVTELEAERKISTFRSNFKNGTGPTSLAEERSMAQKARRQEEARQQTEITVSKLICEYIERHAKRKKVRWREDERSLNYDVLPAWGDRLAKEITRKDAADLLEKIAQRAPVQACNVLEKCRKMFNLAVKWGFVEHNPFAGQERPAPRPERERVLSEGEIRTFWTALTEDNKDIAMSVELRRAFKLILATGQRPGEVIGLHRREINGRWWTVPKERSKNGRPHRVFLTGMALDLIGNGEGFIFPSPKGVGHINENALAMGLRRNILGASTGKKVKGLAGRKKHQAKKKLEYPEPVNRIGVEHFVPHDLRRTVLTGLAKLKIPYEVRERVVNHSLGKLEKTYNLHSYDDEKAAALTRWANYLHAVLAGGAESAKVVDLASRRK